MKDAELLLPAVVHDADTSVEAWPPHASTVAAARAGDVNAMMRMEDDAAIVLDWCIQSRANALSYPMKGYIHFTISRGWHPSYAAAILPMAKDLLAAQFNESPSQTKARLTLALEHARLAAIENNQVNHEIAAIRAQADILLPKTTLNVNTTPSEIKDLRNMTNEELEALLSNPLPPAATPTKPATPAKPAQPAKPTVDFFPDHG